MIHRSVLQVFRVAVAGMIVFASSFAMAQDTSGTARPEEKIKLYIDCSFCDMEYIRQRLTFVDYVRERKEAQVHLIITARFTGSNGTEATLIFTGLQEFSGQNDTLTFSTQADASTEEIRQGMNRMITVGMVRYIAHTPALNHLVIRYENATPLETSSAKDPWRSWVASVNASAYISGEQAYRNLSLYGFAEIRKVTPDWKTELYAYQNVNENTYKVGGETIFVSNRSRGMNASFVKSLTPHSALGTFLNYWSSEYSNMDRAFNAYLGYEYNLFRYEESATRQLRLNYLLGKVWNDYTRTTIYDADAESLYEQKVSASFKFQDTWGSVSTNATWRNYLHDVTLNNLAVSAQVNLRLVKGLSFNMGGNLSLLRNQIALPREGASEEEILLRQQELATSYRYWGNAGLTYTFGSIYNNVVNPRFGN